MLLMTSLESPMQALVGLWNEDPGFMYIKTMDVLIDGLDGGGFRGSDLNMIRDLYLRAR